MQYKDRIKSIICEISPVMLTIEEITEGKKLDEDFGFGSLEFIQLIVQIEEEFGFEFEYERLNIKLINEIDEITKYVETKCQKKELS